MDYTVEMFEKDNHDMRPILRVLQDVELPKDEWPIINIEGIIYSLNPNFAEVDILAFFRTRYGESKGFDYAWRYLRIHWFIKKHHNALLKEKLIRDDQTGYIEIRTELLRVILDSFGPPQPLCTFPVSTLENRHYEFFYTKVLKAVKAKREGKKRRG